MHGTSLARVAGGLLVIVLALSCAQDDDPEGARPSPTEARSEGALPATEFTGEFLQIREGNPGEGGSVVLGSELESSDGTTAAVEISFSDNPPGDGAEVRCGGKTYRAESVLDQSENAEGTIEIEGSGTLELEIERNVGVIAPDQPEPPVCDEWAGTWTGTESLEGRSGTFLLVGIHEGETGEATLTLEED